MEKEPYKRHRINIGGSDIASLTLRSPMQAATLDFVEDGDYCAWLVSDMSVSVPDHYKKVFSCEYWLKIYDDDGLQADFNAKQIEVYRAGDYGCLIRLIN